MAEQLEIDVFWSFRSPWSYLATPRLREWQERYLLKAVSYTHLTLPTKA